MKFEWNHNKAVSNLKKHKISFEMAITVFNDPFALIAPDPKHSTADETREWIIGNSNEGVLVVIWTKRLRGSIYRLLLVLARQAEKKGECMKNIKTFPFEQARRITEEERVLAKKAIEEKTSHRRFQNKSDSIKTLENGSNRGSFLRSKHTPTIDEKGGGV